MADTCNELDVYNEDTESESVKEPDNEETTQHQPALPLLVACQFVPLLRAAQVQRPLIDFAPSFLSRVRYPQPLLRIIGLVLRNDWLGSEEILKRIIGRF